MIQVNLLQIRNRLTDLENELTVADGEGCMHVRLLSHIRLCDPMDCSPPGSSVHGDFSGKNTGVG